MLDYNPDDLDVTDAVDPDLTLRGLAMLAARTGAN